MPPCEAFKWEDVICLHGFFGKQVRDSGLENKEAIKELTRGYRVKKVVLLVYHQQANGMIEKGHKPMVNILSKMSNGGFIYEVQNLLTVL